MVQVGSGDPPKLTVNGPVTVESGAQIEALGEGTQIQLSNVTLSNLGTIEAANLATITIDLKGDSTNAGVIEGFNGGVITLNGNGHGFTNQFLIEAFGEGTQIQLSDITLSNLGTIEAEALATITIGLNGDSTNAGVIEGFNGGVITLNENGHGFTNQFLIEALDGGGISIVGDVTNLAGASIEAIGPNAFIDVSNGTVDNQGGARIEASDRGSITFDSETVTNKSGAKIEAKDLGTITFDVGSVTNDAKIEAKHYGSITFEGSVFVKNNSDATIEATKYGGITLDGGNGSPPAPAVKTTAARSSRRITAPSRSRTSVSRTRMGAQSKRKMPGRSSSKAPPAPRQSSTMKARSKPSAWVRRYRSSTTPPCTAARSTWTAARFSSTPIPLSRVR